jgi:tetratricopeptide (TPR) repeat protein
MKYNISKVYMILLSFSFLFLSVINLYADEGNRLALLIGNSNYKYAGKLDNPINDVRAIEKVLKQLGFTVLKYEDCSQNTIKKAIDKFGRQLKTKDVGLFFYAGHGVQVNGYNYLLPINAKLENENDAEYDCVRAGRILAKMESAGSKTNIVILDACRANPFERAWRRGEKGSGLAFMNAPSGSLIAYSTAPGKTALDGGGRNSPYTRALLKHIDKPDITIIQMFQRVRSTVMKQSDKKQIPWESTSLRGDFYFSGGERINTTKKPNIKSSMIDQNKDDEYIKKLTKNIEINPNTPGAYIKRGVAYFNTEQYGNAIQDFTKAIDLNPEHRSAYFPRGKAYFNLGQYIKAIQDFTKAIDLNPEHRFAYNGRGNAYNKLGQYTKAIQDYTKAIDVDSKSSRAYTGRGFSYFALKQYTKAIQDFTQAIDVNPHSVRAYNGRGNAKFHLKQYKEAIQDYTKAIDLDFKKDFAAYMRRGNAYVKFKQYTKAIQDFTQAIALDEQQAVFAYTARGDLYFDLKQYTRGIQDYTKAIELNPLNPRSYYYRGESYKKLKQFTKAIQDFTQSIDLNPKVTQSYFMRGICYVQTENIRKACLDAKKSCELGDCRLLDEMKDMNYNCE